MYRFAIGAIYEGDYKLNKKDGNGVMTYPDGSKYEGNLTSNVKLVCHERKKSNLLIVKIFLCFSFKYF